MKTKRHTKILELIQRFDIETQEDLLRLLKDEGFDVTQATVSRDIKELRLIKTPTHDGRYKYSIGKSENTDFSAKFYSLFSDSVYSVDYAGNIVSLKSMSGMAQAVCASMDAMRWEGIVGTLAGEDTIFILVRTEERAASLAAEFKDLLVK